MITSSIDSVGAGDSYLAGAASLWLPDTPCRSRGTGSLVAGVTVQKLFQTGTASPEEILQLGTNAEYIESPELAENVRMASYLPDSEMKLFITGRKT
jgi:sugar/nucleoside kinase (ribokinase family)